MLTKLEKRAILYAAGLTDVHSPIYSAAYKYAAESVKPGTLDLQYTQMDPVLDDSDKLFPIAEVKATLKDKAGEPMAGQAVNLASNKGAMDVRSANYPEITLPTDENGEAKATLKFVDGSDNPIDLESICDLEIVGSYDYSEGSVLKQIKTTITPLI